MFLESSRAYCSFYENNRRLIKIFTCGLVSLVLSMLYSFAKSKVASSDNPANGPAMNQGINPMEASQRIYEIVADIRNQRRSSTQDRPFQVSEQPTPEQEEEVIVPEDYSYFADTEL